MSDVPRYHDLSLTPPSPLGEFCTDVLLQSMKDRFTSVPRGDLAATIYRTIENHVETLFDNSFFFFSKV
jgi:hypothetical protein